MTLYAPVTSFPLFLHKSLADSVPLFFGLPASPPLAESLPIASIDPGFRVPGVFQMSATGGWIDFSSISSHVDLLLIGAVVLTAGAGAIAYLMRKRSKAEDPTPNDGVPRTENQKILLQEAIRLEKNLLSTDSKVRLEAIPPLLDLARKLAPADRPQRIQRIAQQLCLDWARITKDAKVGDPIRSRIPRLLAPLLKQLKDALEERAANRQVVNISTNAAAILRWIDGK